MKELTAVFEVINRTSYHAVCGNIGTLHLTHFLDFIIILAGFDVTECLSQFRTQLFIFALGMSIENENICFKGFSTFSSHGMSLGLEGIRFCK